MKGGNLMNLSLMHNLRNMYNDYFLEKYSTPYNVDVINIHNNLEMNNIR